MGDMDSFCRSVKEKVIEIIFSMVIDRYEIGNTSEIVSRKSKWGLTFVMLFDIKDKKRPDIFFQKHHLTFFYLSTFLLCFLWGINKNWWHLP